MIKKHTNLDYDYTVNIRVGENVTIHRTALIGEGLFIYDNVCISKHVEISYGVYIGKDSKIGEGSKIGSDVEIGVGVKISPGINLISELIIPDNTIIKKTPLQIQGSLNPIVAFDSGIVAIGCKDLHIDEWLEKYEMIGKVQGYSAEQIREYGSYLHFMKIMLRK